MIDASRVLAGPFATMLLADLGADVIKLEPPDGDESRTWGPPWWGDPADRRSAYFASVNRNKRSVVLDLRTDGGRATLDGLLATADLLVHNYRPATATRLGLATESLRARHPELIVAMVGGFPGADADRPAYDLLAQAVSGLMSVTGDPDGPPTKTGVALLDLLAGLECAVGALAALLGRGRTGSVQVNLVEAGVTGLINVLGNHLASGEEPGRHGNAHPNIAPYESFEARDGHLVIAVGNDGSSGAFSTSLALMMRGSLRHQPDADRRAARSLPTGWASESPPGIARHCRRACPTPTSPPGRSTASTGAGGHGELGWTTRIDGIELAPGPIRLSGSLPPVRSAPPLLGEHTDEILAALDIDDLRIPEA